MVGFCDPAVSLLFEEVLILLRHRYAHFLFIYMQYLIPMHTILKHTEFVTRAGVRVLHKYTFIQPLLLCVLAAPYMIL